MYICIDKTCMYNTYSKEVRVFKYTFYVSIKYLSTIILVNNQVSDAYISLMAPGFFFFIFHYIIFFCWIRVRHLFSVVLVFIFFLFFIFFFCFFLYRLSSFLCAVLPVSQDCPFLIVIQDFSKVYLHKIVVLDINDKAADEILFICHLSQIYNKKSDRQRILSLALISNDIKIEDCKL